MAKKKKNRADYALRAEAMLLVRRAVEQGSTRAMDWFVHALVKAHPKLSGDDAEWYRYCAYAWARVVVRDALRTLDKPVPEDDEQSEIENSQLLMPGYERLQIAYTVLRNEERMMVPTTQMTPEECRAKADEYERFGKGAITHSRELRRFADELESQTRKSS